MDEKEKEEYIAYIMSRKSSNKKNYYKESLKEIASFHKTHDRKPRILLHVCCIVCACWPLDFLLENGFEVAVMYNNSNIWPEAEHDKRLAEVKRLLHERYHDQIELIVPPYDYDTYAKTVLKNRGTDPEGWTSCFGCYGERMNAAFQYADEHGFDYFTTVMTFSRQKDSQKINEIGLNLGRNYTHTKYFVSDFKKADGALKSDAICNEYCIYRQDYCGCEYSYHERHPEDTRES